jgi:L-fuconolactonase
VGIVDAHVHLWDPTGIDYPWLGEVPSLRVPRLPADYAAATDGLGVTAMVVVEAAAAPGSGEAELAWLVGLARSEPRIRAIVAEAPLEQGLAVRPRLERLAGEPLVAGVRRLIQDETADFCLRPEFVEGVRLLGDFGLSFDLCVRHEQLDAAAELARRAPGVTFVLDHLGKPPVSQGASRAWETRLRRLADLPHVTCKLSGLATEAGPGGATPEVLAPYLETALDAFGWDRVLFGSDWPVCELATSSSAWLDLVTSVLSEASPAQRRLVLAENAARVYGFAADPAPSAGGSAVE